MAYHQHWYCTVCEAGYKTVHGMLVQMVCDGQASFCRSECADDAFKQIKAASVQRLHPNAQTPEDLLAAIPEAAIRPTSWIRPIPDKPGSYTFDADVFESVPCMKWNQLLADIFLGEGATPPPPPLPTSKRSRRRAAQAKIEQADL